MSSPRNKMEKKAKSVVFANEPRLPNSRVAKSILSDGILFTVEVPIDTRFEREKHTVIIYYAEEKPKQINLNRKIDDLIPVPGGKQFITVRYETLHLALWDVPTMQRVNCETVAEDDIEYTGDITLICLENQFLLKYPSQESENYILELRDLKTFKLLDSKIAQKHDDEPIQHQIHKGMFIFHCHHGFEQWHINNNKLEKIDGAAPKENLLEAKTEDEKIITKIDIKPVTPTTKKSGLVAQSYGLFTQATDLLKPLKQHQDKEEKQPMHKASSIQT